MSKLLNANVYLFLYKGKLTDELIDIFKDKLKDAVGKMVCL